jgi:Ca2+-binding EF-hand superfamily protein
LTFIVTNITSHDDVKELQNLFKKLDTNLDGKLSEAELIEGILFLIKVTSKYTLTWMMSKSWRW